MLCVCGRSALNGKLGNSGFLRGDYLADNIKLRFSRSTSIARRKQKNSTGVEFQVLLRPSLRQILDPAFSSFVVSLRSCGAGFNKVDAMDAAFATNIAL